MSFVQRQALDADFEDAYGDHIICKCGRYFRIYAKGGGYTTMSGDLLKRGHVLKGLEGKPLNFPTVKGALRWLVAGMPLCDSRGNDLNPLTY